MKAYLPIIVILCALTFPIFAQENNANHSVGLAEISQANQGNSFITFPTDIGNIEPLWFEGNLIPNFHLRKSKNSRLMGVLTPQIIIRMFQERSNPVRTPSYLPQITLYFLLNNTESLHKISLFGRIAHHSNGQEGQFFLPDSSINLKSGSFSTNFYQVGVLFTNFSNRFKAHQFFKTSFEMHPKTWTDDELDGIFSPYRWHTAFSIFKIPEKKDEGTKKKADISIKGETTWMFGNVYDWQNFSLNRLNLTLTMYWHPKCMEDVGLFVQYYHGSDYYNIYFSHRVNIVRFGLMTDILRF